MMQKPKYSTNDYEYEIDGFVYEYKKQKTKVRNEVLEH